MEVRWKIISFLARKLNEYFTELGLKLIASIEEGNLWFNDCLNQSSILSSGFALTTPGEIIKMSRELSNTWSSTVDDDIKPHIAKSAKL